MFLVLCPDEKPSVLPFARDEQKPGLVIILSHSHEAAVFFSREYLEERHDQVVFSRTAQCKRETSSNRHGLLSGALVPVALQNSFRMHQLVAISNRDVVIALWTKMAKPTFVRRSQRDVRGAQPTDRNCPPSPHLLELYYAEA